MTPTCIDLRERFGGKYRVRYEESYYAERGEGARKHDPWLTILLCERGHIFPWGGDELAASTDKPGPTALALKRLDCCRIGQDGDDGVTVVFDVTDFDRVAALMKPRRRRRLSEAQKAICAERLARVRPQPLRGASDSVLKREFRPRFDIWVVPAGSIANLPPESGLALPQEEPGP